MGTSVYNVNLKGRSFFGPRHRWRENIVVRFELVVKSFLASCAHVGVFVRRVVCILLFLDTLYTW